MFGFNPYFALAGVLALAAAAGGGYLKGEDHAHAKADQAALHQLTNALSDRDAKQKQIDVLETAAAVREQNRQTSVREITREIPEVITRDHVVYDRTCVDAAGVSLLDRAAAAANGHPGIDPGAPAGGTGGAAADPAHP
jgi:hypothetical protein